MKIILRSLKRYMILDAGTYSVVGQVCDRILVMKDGEVVESGPSRDVLLAPQHPYTRRLLAALPVLPAAEAA